MAVVYGIGTYGNISVRGQGVVSVGKYCSIATGVKAILLPGHRTDWVTTYPFPVLWKVPIKGHPTTPSSIFIENDVWIGRGAVLLEGAKVGSGAVIGAYSIVAGEIEPYTVVAGNPAKPIRKRFPKKTVDALIELAWWDWPKDKILENMDLLCSGEVKELIKKHGSDKGIAETDRSVATET